MKGADAEKGSKVLVGTASWSDPGFVEQWYPKGMRAGERLAWYAQHFEMVEVNSTFYSVPDARMVERWCASTPDEFTFDVKLHQLFSFHSTPAKLLPPDLQRRAEIDAKGKVKSASALREAMLDIFLRSMSILQREKKLGTLLLQLSPAFSPRKHELAELEQLIERLRDYSLAIEFRNRNWAVGEQLRSTIDFLRERDVAFVNVDAPAAEHFTIMPPDLNEITNPQRRLSAVAWPRRESVSHRQNGGGAFQLRLLRQGNRRGGAARAQAGGGSGRGARRLQQQRARFCAARGFASAHGARANLQAAAADR